MKKIFKYQVQHNSGEGVHPLYFRVNMPKGAQILSAGEQEDKDTWVGHSSLYIWAIVDPDKPIVERTILDVGTGMVFDKDETFRKFRRRSAQTYNLYRYRSKERWLCMAHI